METLLSRRWRGAYRIIMFLLCAIASCLFLAFRFLINVSYSHASQDGYQAEHLEMYAWLTLALLSAAEAISLFVFRLFTRTKITLVFAGLLALIAMSGFTYRYILPMVTIYRFTNAIRAAMTVGQVYMDSLTEKDFQAWSDRTENLLAEYEPGTGPIGVYGLGGKPVPAELQRLGIIRIDILQDQVRYVWMGGMDHTGLEVDRLPDGTFRFIAHYNDYKSEVIWPKRPNQAMERSSAVLRLHCS